MRHCDIAPLHQLGICHNNVTVDIHLCTVCMFDVHMNISTGICLQYAYKAIAHKVNTHLTATYLVVIE
jgi:hypothetical protein